MQKIKNSNAYNYLLQNAWETESIFKWQYQPNDDNQNTLITTNYQFDTITESSSNSKSSIAKRKTRRPPRNVIFHDQKVKI